MIELSTYSFEVLRSDKELSLYRGTSEFDDSQILVLSPAAEHPAPETLRRLEHEYSLREELELAWATRPIAIAHHWGRTVLVLQDPGGVPLDQLLGQPLELVFALRLAVDLAGVIDRLHQRGIIHKDIKPSNVLADAKTGQCWLKGFGIASRLPRERQSAKPPELVAGTLAYMAPEQTGRMNRSIDRRSDLYSLGISLYEMLTGALPFTASDPMEWVHCHIAREPISPSERLSAVPVAVSAVVMKLLAKTVEERYQTAAGVQADLRRCLALWEEKRMGRNDSESGAPDPERAQIEAFLLGKYDVPDRLLIPEKLYGRAREIDTLLASFDRIVSSGRPELVLVSGYSGIGKSSVVNELHKVLVPPRGLFASGKFDQYKRDIPYWTLVQAFQSLVRPILGKSDSELAMWRGAFLEALEPNARLMTDLIPELKLIIGEQPPIPELEPQQAQSRFQLVFRRFIGVFARPEHPLALFLDDLQWLDAATLDLMEDLLSRSDLRHLMLIGAYRDNEVSSAHPLMRKLEAVRQTGVEVHEIVLAPLAGEDLGLLITDALHCESEDGPASSQPSERVNALARLVHDKTAGNPFFALQFISALAEEALLFFDHGSGRWSWDLSRIQAKGYSDNVVDLMIGKLNRLPVETQKALQEFACLGNSAKITTLSVVHGLVLRSQDGEGGLVLGPVRHSLGDGGSPAPADEGGSTVEAVHRDLWEAVRLEFIVRSEDSYRFVHDRVQEAAYSLIPEQLRTETHLRIGRLLAGRTTPERREGAIFEIVNQLNRGTALITSQGEREQLAELNLIAGKRAKASTAYVSALRYLTAGAALLPNDSWEHRHELTFALEFNRAECEFLIGEPAAAAERLAVLSSRAVTTVEQASVTCLRMDVYTNLDRTGNAIAVWLDHLRHFGIEWSPHPKEEEIRREYERIWSLLGNRAIEDLIDLPPMEDPASLATVDLLSKAEAPLLHSDANLHSLAVCRAVNLSIEHGNCDASCLAYVDFARFAGPLFGDYKAGFRFGQLGYELFKGCGPKRLEGRFYVSFAVCVVRWSKHVRASRDLLRRAFEAANRIGDLMYAAYASDNLNSDLLFAGEPLLEVQGEAEQSLAFAEKARFGLVIDIIKTQLALIRMLRGLALTFGCFNDEHFDEVQMESHLSSGSALAIGECWYWVRKLQARYIAGDYAAALDAAANAQRLLWTSNTIYEGAEYHFYSALSQTAYSDSAPAGERQQVLKAIAAHHRQLKIWAENCPENFENRAALVSAEIARIEGRDFEAMGFYEEAIRSARTNGFVQNEALGGELAARFYAARGFEDISHLYLKKARYCYLRWGAEGKVRQLEELYPQLREEEPIPGPTSTIGTPVEHLDLATIMKVSQAVSGEIVLEKLIDMLMRTAIEHAGAERGLLILPRGVEQRIEAEATTSGDTIIVRLREALVAEAAVPESIVHYVARTSESVILDDALAQNPFSNDEYFRAHQLRSVLCLPLIKQTKVIGVLYLENNLAPYVFTATRIAVLKLLASQAAICLENSRLYRDLEAREAKIRRLVDANIIGIFIWKLDGQIVEANEAFLNLVNYSREDLISGRLSWVNMTPTEWRDLTERGITQLRTSGVLQPYEKEYFRSDGSRAPVLVGSALLEEDQNEGVSFVLDLSERKRSEEALRRRETDLREAQAELAHVSRVATMGELTASIAHEVNQPLSAALNNVSALVRWLAANNLEEARESATRVISNVHRAGEIIAGIRALAKKAPPQQEPLDINEAIREVFALVRSELHSNDVTLQTQLANDLPLIIGDRVQLQQVMLNLLVNAIEAMSDINEDQRILRVSSQRTIEPSCSSEHVLIAVRDSGPGLDMQNLDRLFDTFYTTKAQGLGMGLAISRSIIEAHGGRLWAEANLPKGALFQFTLPTFADGDGK